MGLGTFRVAPLNSLSSSSPERLKENQATNMLLFLPRSQGPPTSRVDPLTQLKSLFLHCACVLQRPHAVQWPPQSISPSTIYTELALHSLYPASSPQFTRTSFPPVSTLSVLIDYTQCQSLPVYTRCQSLHSLQSAQFLELINQTHYSSA